MSTTPPLHERKALRDVVTPADPLGPPYSEALLRTSPEVFAQLYDETNHIHNVTRSENPSYIVGRKGAGKTAFLIGGALAEGAEVVLLQSEHLYTEVNRLRLRYEAINGPLVADNLVHVWEVLFFHAAMWRLSTSDALGNSPARRRVWTYMTAFGDPMMLEADALTARVSGLMLDALLNAPAHLAFREACWSIDPGQGSFLEAAAEARRALEGCDVRVVVDNLEDLHKKLDAFESVITALFRVVSRRNVVASGERLPFHTRFAFPAELLPRLSGLTANAEKDFLDYLLVRWTARELITLAGNRLRTFLDAYHPDAWRRLGLPHAHDPADRDAAELTLRTMLPPCIVNGYRGEEDPVAYVMRHTQLLPRHLIEILNEIISPAVRAASEGRVPRATAAHVIDGVRRAEETIVRGILSTFSYRFGHIQEAIGMIKNHVGVVESESRLHRAFNRAAVIRSGLDFDEFLDACLSIGALGMVDEDAETARYVVGEFAYTSIEPLRPVEDRERLCVHPLFMYRFFDRRIIQQLPGGTKAVYPYGSDPDHLSLHA